MTRQQMATWLAVVALPWAAGWGAAQVPAEMYMQGQFLKTNGTTPDTGAHALTATIYKNGASALAKTFTVTAGVDGVAGFSIADGALPAIFQGSTNTAFQLTGGTRQPYVTTPYAFAAANLPKASGNFTVWGNLTVSSNAELNALTAENGGTVSGPLMVRGSALFTNMAQVTFNNNMNVSGGMVAQGPVQSLYNAQFTSAATSHFYAATNDICLSNTTIHTTFGVITQAVQGVGNSGTATEDGFLMVWLKVTTHGADGVYVTIDGLQFKIRHYLNSNAGTQDLSIYNGYTYPVAAGSTWSVALVSQGDSGINITCYWMPLRGGG